MFFGGEMEKVRADAINASHDLVDNLYADFTYLIGSEENAEPNYWQPYMMCDSSIEAKEIRSESSYSYSNVHGTSSPMEIIDALDAFGADALPIYTPTSMQSVFEGCKYITQDGVLRLIRLTRKMNRCL